MRRKFRNRQKSGIRISLRTLLYAGAFSAVVLLMLSIFVVSFFKEEESLATVNPMVVTGITVVQDTGSVYSGMRDVAVLKITVNARGTGNRLSLSEMKFSARGTSAPFSEIIKNGRLWYTAGDPNFGMTRQFGNTISQLEEVNFKFVAKQLLQEGPNYFWLAFDTGIQTIEGTTIDAELIGAVVSTLTLEPDISAPAGNIRLLPNTPWYSTGNTEIASLESWNSSRDGSGTRPANFSKSTGTFHIQAGHSMQNKLNACLPTMIIERNGTLINETSVTADLILVKPGGTLVNKSDPSAKNKLKKLQVESGGMYVHSTPHQLLSRNTEFADNSTATFLNLPKETTDHNPEFGNVVIVETGQPNLLVSFPLGKVKGDLEFRGSGRQNTITLAAVNHLNVAGDMVVNNVSLNLSVKEETAKISIGEKLYIKNGLVSDGTGNVSLELGTNFIMKEGEFMMKHPKSEIIISKPATNWYQEGSCVLPDFSIMPGSVLKLKSAEFGSVGMHRKLTVKDGGTIDCSTGVITGEGKLQLESGATLITAHPKGISSDEMSGCIQTWERIFSSDASYQFNGSATPQLTGNFETKPLKGTVKNFIVEKSEITGVVILQNNLHCSGTFIRRKGNLNKNGFSVTTGNAGIAQKAVTLN